MAVGRRKPGQQRPQLPATINCGNHFADSLRMCVLPSGSECIDIVSDTQFLRSGSRPDGYAQDGDGYSHGTALGDRWAVTAPAALRPVNNFTLAWVGQVGALPAARRLLAGTYSSTDVAPWDFWNFYRNTDGTLKLGSSTGTTYKELSTASNYPTGTRVVAVLRRYSGGHSAWVNGKSEGSLSYSGDVTYGSTPTLFVGVALAGHTNTDAITHGLLLWDKVLSDDELTDFEASTWQMLNFGRRSIYVPSGAPATQDASHVASGGATAGGSADSSREQTAQGSGGAASGGAASTSRESVATGSGGASTGGAAETSKEAGHVASGGGVSGGSAATATGVDLPAVHGSGVEFFPVAHPVHFSPKSLPVELTADALPLSFAPVARPLNFVPIARPVVLEA